MSLDHDVVRLERDGNQRRILLNGEIVWEEGTGGRFYADAEITRLRAEVENPCGMDGGRECEARVLLESLPTWGTYGWRQAATSISLKLSENAAQIVQLMTERDARQRRVEFLERRIKEQLGHPEPFGTHDGDPNFLCAVCQWYGEAALRGEASTFIGPSVMTVEAQEQFLKSAAEELMKQAPEIQTAIEKIRSAQRISRALLDKEITL